MKKRREGPTGGGPKEILFPQSEILFPRSEILFPRSDEKDEDKNSGVELRWPVGYDDETGRPTAPASATPGRKYHFDIYIGGKVTRVPLILKSNKNVDGIGGGGKRRRVAAHFAAAAFVANGMTAWHMLWQAFAKRQFREVSVEDNRADIKTPDGRVIEIQHSKLARDDVLKRNKTYKEVVWVLDARLATIVPLGYLRSQEDDKSDSAEHAAIQIKPDFPSATVLSTSLSGTNISMPFLSTENATPQRSFDNYLDRFRFRSANTKGSEDEKKTTETDAGLVRVYLDVGMKGHLLRVWKYDRIATRCSISIIPIQDFLRQEYGGALDLQNLPALLAERDNTVDHAKLLADLLVKSANGWRLMCDQLRMQQFITQQKSMELERAAEEGLILRKVARLCDECRGPFALLTPMSKHCPSCVQKAAVKFDERKDIDCHKCGTIVSTKLIGQEPFSGRFYCPTCAKPCAKNGCQKFAFSKFKLCPSCAQLNQQTT